MRIMILCIFSVFIFADDCKNCHNIESFDEKNHNFSCLECHIKEEKRLNYSHDDIIIHPASMENVQYFCAKCHEKQINKFKKSNHYTLKNEINTIFASFNLDTNYTLQTLPKISNHPNNKKEIIIDLLRRKCLRCHTESKKTYEYASYRGKGCMACHIKYAKNGKYQGSDKLIKGKFGYAKFHTLLKSPPQSACLSCHNKEFIGNEYLGLFPKDYDQSYRSPIDKNGKFPVRKYGIDFHSLSEDIHFQKGLTCVDCHNNSKEKLSCKNCHANTQKTHDNYHENLNCTTCHASWQGSHYELNLLRDDTSNYSQWSRLHVQEDEYVEKFLNHAKHKSNIKPSMPDFIEGKFYPGIWYSGWRMRRWENVSLAQTNEGKITLLRPFFQYRISYKDKFNKMIFDDFFEDESGKFEAFLPYSPHTIGKKAKSCETCHENTLKQYDYLGLFEGRILKAKKLSEKTKQKLHSKKYKKIRAKILFE